MSDLLVIFALLNVLFIAEVLCAKGYYWRDYDGTIPEDALPAGEQVNGTFYIGQAYIHNYGLMLGTIVSGKKEVTVPCYGVRKNRENIKILCTENPDNFYWMKSNVTAYKNSIETETPVIGGADYVATANFGIAAGILHVGRTKKHGDVIIGNIAAYEVKYPWFYYPLLDKEIASADFEALIYDMNNLKEIGASVRMGTTDSN